MNVGETTTRFADTINRSVLKLMLVLTALWANRITLPGE